MAGSLGDLIVQVGAKIDGFTDAMKEVQQELDKMGSHSEESGERVGNAFQRMGHTIMEHTEEIKEHCEAIGKAAIGLQAVGFELSEVLTERFKEIGEEALKTAGNTEQLEIIFRSLSGSGQEASEMVESLHKFAGTSVLPLATLEQGAQRLMAFGFAGKDVIPIMKTLTDVSMAFGHGSEGVDAMVGALTKVRTQGQFSSRNMRAFNQFGGTQALAEGLGVSQSEALAQVKKGIPAETGINALLAGWQKNFGGIAQEQLGTFNGMLANLKNKIELTMDEIGKALLPPAKLIEQGLLKIMEVLQQLAQWFGTLPTPVQDTVVAFLALLAAAGPFLVVIGGIALAFASLIGSIAAVVSAVVALGASMAATALIVAVPLVAIAGMITAAMAALAPFAIWAAQHWEGVKAAAAVLWDGIQEKWNATLGPPINWVKETVNEFLAFIKLGWSVITDLTSKLFEPVKVVWESTLGVAVEWAKRKLAELEHPLDAIFGKAEAAFDKAESNKKDDDAFAAAKRTLGIGVKRFSLTPDKEAFDEKHKKEVEEFTKAVEEVNQRYKAHKATIEEVTAAHKALNDKMAEKFQPNVIGGKSGKDEVKHAALDKLAGEMAHEEAIAKLQRSAAEQQFKLAQPDNKTDDPAGAAQQEIAAAATRRQQLQSIAGDELNQVLATIDKKLALYRKDSAEYTRTLQEKAKAQDKFVQEFQAAGFQEQDIDKRVNAESEKEQQRHLQEIQRAATEHSLAMAHLASAVAQQKIRNAQEEMRIDDEQAKFRLDIGELTKTQYLKIKQEEIDKAYQMELAALTDEQTLFDKEKAIAMAEAGDDPIAQQKVSDKFKGQQQQITDKRQDINTRRNGDTLGIGNELKQDNYNRWFKPIESSFTTGITAMIEGTKSFKQAFADMGRSILDSWIKTLVQQKVAFFTAKLQEVLFHRTADQMKVASTAQAAAQSKSISLGQHFHEAMLNAKGAAGAAFKAVAGIPYVGPILAPIAAAAAFARVMMISAEHGAVLPNENTIAMLHPREMVLPSHLAEGIQDLIATGSAPSHKNMGFMPSGAPTSQVQQMMTAASAGGDSHFHGGIQLTYHASKGENLSSETVFNMVQRAARMKNLKMA